MDAIESTYHRIDEPRCILIGDNEIRVVLPYNVSDLERILSFRTTYTFILRVRAYYNSKTRLLLCNREITFSQ